MVAGGLLLVAAVGVPVAARTRALNRLLDGWTISLMARVARRAPAATNAALPWSNAAELESMTRAPGQQLDVTVQPMTRFRLHDPALTQEVIAFPSAVRLDHPESNVARAYVYRRGRLGERPIVVWVPGQYALDAWLAPFSGVTEEIVRRGVDVVLLVPPYHLERTPAGFSSGDAVLAASTPDHLRVFAQELSDLRRIVGWLRGLGPPALGGLGTSLGGALLLRTVTWDSGLDFLTVIIPAISPGDILDDAAGALFRLRLAAEGRSPADLSRLYASLDPTGLPPRLSASRISVLYGRHDRIAGERRILDWAAAWGVTRLYAYPRGHALALFAPSMYADYARVLDEDLRALGR